MADKWFSNHSITWTRKTRGARVGINDATLTDATGFPKTIKGDLQQVSGSRTVQVRGVEVTVNAVLFTLQSGIGANDLVTLSGKTYTVLSVLPISGPNNTVDHYECELRYET